MMQQSVNAKLDTAFDVAKARVEVEQQGEDVGEVMQMRLRAQDAAARGVDVCERCGIADSTVVAVFYRRKDPPRAASLHPSFDACIIALRAQLAAANERAQLNMEEMARMWAGEKEYSKTLQEQLTAAEQAKAQAERERDRLQDRVVLLDEPWVDENGNAWNAPTAWAYAQACKALDKMRSELARARRDGERIEWLAMHVVEVREPARFGSWLVFRKLPDEPDDEGEAFAPWDIRAAIDAAAHTDDAAGAS
jgi:hypothetical protein